MARTRADEPVTLKPKSDAYTGMLTLSLIALLGACGLLYMDIKRYPSNEPPKVQPSSDAKAPVENPPKPDPNPPKPMPMPMK